MIAALALPIINVVLVCPGEQMVRIDAEGIVAGMAGIKAIRNGPLVSRV